QGHRHPMARPEFDRGPASQDLRMDRMLLVLSSSPEQEVELTQLLDQQQDQASPVYHQWLTPEQFGERFGPSESDIQVVNSWLQTHGFQVESVAKGRNLVEFSGTVRQVEAAFHTSIRRYGVHGVEHIANSSDPEIPAALATVVTGFVSLHDFET